MCVNHDTVDQCCNCRIVRIRRTVIMLYYFKVAISVLNMPACNVLPNLALFEAPSACKTWYWHAQPRHKERLWPALVYLVVISVHRVGEA